MIVSRLRAVRDGVLTQLREWVFPLRVHHVAGARQVDAAPDELVVVCLVRDGAAYLDGFLEHYRSLGARHLVLLDNGSEDGTVERAASEPDVTVLRTRAPYRSHKTIAKRYLVRRFGAGNWVLCVDIDELFDYPFRARLPLRGFLDYLSERRFTAVAAQLLDLFPAGPLTAASSTDWRTEHRHYDTSQLVSQPYAQKYGTANRVSNPRIAVLHGGVRETGFGVRPMLTKHPLLFPAGGAELLSSHNVRGARIADLSAVLLHYKFVSGFLEYARRLVEEGSFYRGSAEYRGYLEALERDPAHTLHSAHARELRSVDQLLDEGFLVASAAFRDHARGPGGDGAAIGPPEMLEEER